jgi:hypothetical protein
MMNDKYYKQGGPAFFQFGGEGAITDGFLQTGLLLMLYKHIYIVLANGTNLMEYMRAVKKYNGIAFQVEHRYYGESKPIK